MVNATSMIMVLMLNVVMFCDDYEHGEATWVALVLQWVHLGCRWVVWGGSEAAMMSKLPH